MEGFRSKLDEILASPPLCNKAQVEEIVRQQLKLNHLLCDEELSDWTKKKFLQRRVDDIWAALESCRISSDWKLKEENKYMRVMYRQRIGMPFHSYCIEGLINGPIAHALCVVWEIPLFKQWWPQFTVPTFKIVESQRLRRLTTCDNLFLMRLKMSWPLAMRELVLTSFEFECFQHNLVVGALAPVCSSSVAMEYGYEGSDVPKEDEDVVRMDAHGGFVLHKLSHNLTYFRAIVDLDLKLEFVPSWIINFIGRQVLGHGFKFYQKAVLGVEKNSDFEEIIKADALYKRVAMGMSNI